MITDSILSTNFVETDICIIGAGAAGIVLALELENSGYKVCLIESGNDNVLKEDPLYEFESSELQIPTNSRVRAFGGTTTVWSGRWRLLDPIDFMLRPWVKNSGWPLEYESLVPYYNRASNLFGFNKGKVGVTNLLSESLIFKPTLFEQDLSTKRHWADIYREKINKSENIFVHLNTHALKLNRQGNKISSVLAHKPSGEKLSIQAKKFVLATGGIENARILLLSDVGNNFDQVGRYFMDHPKGASGIIETYKPLSLFKDPSLNNRHNRFFAGFKIEEEVQKKYEILNSYIICESFLAKNSWINKLARIGFFSKTSIFRIYNFMEQAPDPENRVFLGDKKDKFGYPRAVGRWTIGSQERKTMKIFHELFKKELEKYNIGELDSPLVLEADDSKYISQDSSHHMGVTRMGVDPKCSVVDSDCKVHGIDNLFIAGSSVFPTGGSVNPTATIAALAVRLADHLKTNI